MIAVYRYLKSHRRLFFIILLSLLMLGILPVGFFAGLTYRYFRDYVESQVVSAQLDRLYQTESYIAAVLDEAEAGSYEFVLNIRFMDVGNIGIESVGHAETALAARRVQELLANLRDTSQFIESAYYYNPQRDFLITSEGSLVRPKYHDTDWIASGLPEQEAAPVWLPTRLSLDESIRTDPARVRIHENLGLRSVPVLTFVRPVSRFVAAFGGYVIININAVTLADELAVVSREPDGEFLIVDATGTVILSTKMDSVGTTLHVGVGVPGAQPREGTMVVDRDMQSLIVYYHVSDDGWVYAFARDAGALLDLYREIGRVMLVLALAIGAVATAAAVVSSRMLYSPIDSIMSDIGAQAERLPAGKNELAYIHDVLERSIQESADLRAFAGRSAQAIKENALRRLISGQALDAAMILQSLRVGDHRVVGKWFGIAIVVTDPIDNDQTVSPAQLRVAQMALIRYCESLRVPATEMLGVTTEIRRIALLINTDDPQAVKETLLRVADESLRALEMKATIVVGRFHTSVLDATASYDDAVAVLDSRILEEGMSVVLRDEVEPSQHGLPSYPFEIEERLIYHLKTDHRQDVMRQLDRFLKHVYHSHQIDRSQVESACVALISSVLRAVTLAGANTGTGFEHENPYRSFLEQNLSVESIRTWFVRFLEDTMDHAFARGDRFSTYKRLVEKCIEESYAKDISLEQVADLTGVSYSYLRKIFFAMFGMHFNYYLNGLRIDKAREYLRTTDDSVAEIARSVGYTNEQRFYRNFKKLTGCTPKDYRLATSATSMEGSR